MMDKAVFQYINRDISWLSFNKRVLDEASDRSLPLYERLKFLAIYSSNLDEFYKVRVASYRRTLKHLSENPEVKPTNPGEVLTNILNIVDSQQNEFGRIFWKELVPELRRNNIILIQNRRLSKVHQDYIRQYFYEEVLPYLQPIILLKGKISPFLRDGAVYLAIKLYRKSPKSDTSKKKRARYAIVNIPTESGEL